MEPECVTIQTTAIWKAVCVMQPFCSRYFAKWNLGIFALIWTWPVLEVIGVLICTEELYDFLSAIGSLDNITRFYHTDALECDVFW